MKIKNFIAFIMLTIFSYNCANNVNNNNENSIEYLDVFFTYYKDGEDASGSLDLKIPKETELININGPILINFKNKGDDSKYKVVIFNNGKNIDAKFPDFLIDGDNNSIVEIINKDNNSIVQSFIINYQK